MQLALRPYVTTGIALVGASVIAISPISPVTSALPDIHVPAIHASSVAVELTAMANPIGQWMDVFGTAFNNVAQIGGAIVSDPAPLLRQIIANQIGYGQTIVTGLMGAGVALNNYVTVAVPTALRAMGAQISQGDIVGATTTLINTFSNLVLVGFPLFPLVNIPGKITDNLTNLVHAATGVGTLLTLVLGVMNPMKATMAATGDIGQALVNAIGAGDPVTAIGALINAPAVLAGALLNGYTSSAGATFGGLLSYGEVLGTGGLVQTLLVTLPRMLAAAIAPPAPPVVEPPEESPEESPEEIGARVDISSIPAVIATTVSLNTAAPPIETLPATEPEPESPVAADAEIDAATDESTDVPATTEEPTVEPATTEEPTADPATTEEPTADPATTAESSTAITPVVTKDGNKVVPAIKAGTTHKSGDQTQAGLTALGDQVGAAAKNFGDGIKKALGGNRSTSSANSSSSTGTGGGE